MWISLSSRLHNPLLSRSWPNSDQPTHGLGSQRFTKYAFAGFLMDPKNNKISWVIRFVWYLRSPVYQHLFFRFHCLPLPSQTEVKEVKNFSTINMFTYFGHSYANATGFHGLICNTTCTCAFKSKIFLYLPTEAARKIKNTVRQETVFHVHDNSHSLNKVFSHMGSRGCL